MYSRADLSRTVSLVVALFLTAISTSAVAREFRAADTQSEDYPTVQALRYMGRLIAERSGGRHQIRVFHSRQLGEEKETIEQTRAGAIDLNRTNVALIGDFRAGDECAGDAVPVSLDRASAEGAGRPDRQRNPGQLRALRIRRPGLLRFRRALDLQQRAADPLDRRHEGPADSRAAIRTDVRHDQGARRRAGRAALWPGAHRACHQADRRRREQLAVLRHHRPLQICRLSTR